MTREEAIKICRHIGNSRPWYESDVDQIVALGLLELDEPDIRSKLLEKLPDMKRRSADSILDAIDRAGLKLVDK